MLANSGETASITAVVACMLLGTTKLEFVQAYTGRKACCRSTGSHTGLTYESPRSAAVPQARPPADSTHHSEGAQHPTKPPLTTLPPIALTNASMVVKFHGSLAPAPDNWMLPTGGTKPNRAQARSGDSCVQPTTKHANKNTTKKFAKGCERKVKERGRHTRTNQVKQ
jgi:hypothetical protein